jgi:hypothetical protein
MRKKAAAVRRPLYITGAIAIEVATLTVLTVAGQSTFPSGRPRGEVEKQIAVLEQQTREIDSLRREHQRLYFGAIDVALNRLTDATVGTVLIRSDEVTKLESSLQELRRAVAAGQEIPALLKFNEAFQIIKGVAERLTGEANPKDLAERFWEAKEPARESVKAFADIAAGMRSDEILKTISAALNADIARLERELPSAPYSRAQRAPAPQETRDFSNLDDAIRLMEWLDKGNRAFRTAAEKRAFFEKFPQLAAYDAIAEVQAPEPVVSRPSSPIPDQPPPLTGNDACQAEYYRRRDVWRACRERTSACVAGCRDRPTVGQQFTCSNSCYECGLEAASWDEIKCKWY